MTTKGYRTYAQILGMLPASNAEISERIGCTKQRAAIHTKGLCVVGLAHVERIERPAPRQWFRVFGLGGDRSDGKPRAMMIALASLWRALAEPTSTLELSAETGIDRRQVLLMVGHLREANLVRISGWEGAGPVLTPLYVQGSAADKRKPPKIGRKAINRKYWAAYAAKRKQAAMNLLIAGGTAANDEQRASA